MIRRFENILKQANGLLFYLEYMPVLIMALALSSFGIFFNIIWDYLYLEIPLEFFIYPEWFLKWENIVRQFFECSFALLLIFWCSMYKWKFIARLSTICLTTLWLNSFVYVVLQVQGGIYFFCAVMIIYTTFVILTVAKFTNRC